MPQGPLDVPVDLAVRGGASLEQGTACTFTDRGLAPTGMSVASSGGMWEPSRSVGVALRRNGDVRYIDRDRHPLRFMIAASTLGGLSVAAVTAIATGVFNSGFLMRMVPLWSLLAIAGALLVALSLVWIQHHWRGSKRVFLVIPAFSQKHWIAEIVQNVHRSLDRRGYDLVLKIPDMDFTATGQTHHLRRILRQRADYVGGFIIPNEIGQMRDDLIKFCGQAAMPVVFMDIEPFVNERDYPVSTAFVGYAAAEIGELAARWVAEYLRRTQERRPVVLVVSGDAQHLRQHRFKEVLSHSITEVQIVDDSGEFIRMRARDVVYKQLKQFRSKGQRVHAIFCTNDEMALGAVDALHSVDPATAHETAVVGVDGTPQARALIDAGPSALRATVSQDSCRLAEHAVDLLERMLNKDEVTTRTLLALEVYTRD